MNRLSISRQVVRESFSLVWHNKRLLWYFFFIAVFTLGFLPVTLFLATRYIPSLSNALDMLQNFTFWNIFSPVKAISLFVPAFVFSVFYAALFVRVYALLSNKKISFIKSFSFAKGLMFKLVLWSLVLMVISLAKSKFSVRSGLNFRNVGYGKFFLYLLLVAVYLVWFLVESYVLPALVKKNKSLWQAMSGAIQFVWRHLLIVASSYLMILLWILICVSVILVPIFIAMWFSGVTINTLLMGLMWIVGVLFTSSFREVWPFWLTIIAVKIPLVLLFLYLMTVFKVLPAVVYNKLAKLK